MAEVKRIQMSNINETEKGIKINNADIIAVSAVLLAVFLKLAMSIQKMLVKSGLQK